MHDSIARQRFSAIMLGAFAVFALILAVVGVYGVMSYLVTQGTHDIGVRMALGAAGQHRRHGGAAGDGADGRRHRRGPHRRRGADAGDGELLFGVSPIDVATFAAVTAILAATGAIASYVPALRATRVDPVVALREE